jgi:hypothetical protein
LALFPRAEHGMTEYEVASNGERVSTRYAPGYFTMMRDYARNGHLSGSYGSSVVVKPTADSPPPDRIKTKKTREAKISRQRAAWLRNAMLCCAVQSKAGAATRCSAKQRHAQRSTASHEAGRVLPSPASPSLTRKRVAPVLSIAHSQNMNVAAHVRRCSRHASMTD